MLCAATQACKRTAHWLSAWLPTPFTFSACPDLDLDQFWELLRKLESFLAVGAGGVQVISTVSVLNGLWAQLAENCFLSKVCIWSGTLRFLFVTDLAVNLPRTGCKLCFHTHHCCWQRLVAPLKVHTQSRAWQLAPDEPGLLCPVLCHTEICWEMHEQRGQV